MRSIRSAGSPVSPVVVCGVVSEVMTSLLSACLVRVLSARGGAGADRLGSPGGGVGGGGGGGGGLGGGEPLAAGPGPGLRGQHRGGEGGQAGGAEESAGG